MPNIIEDLNLAVHKAVEDGIPPESMRWTLSHEGVTKIKAATTAAVQDPFWQSKTLLGLPFTVSGDSQKEDFILHHSRNRDLQACVLSDEDRRQIREEASFRRRTGR